MRFLLFLAGMMIGGWLFAQLAVYAMAWDDAFETCCIEAWPQTQPFVEKYMLYPVIGSSLGGLIVFFIFHLLGASKSEKDNK